MVGIVLVSHSHRIAEGAAELARQMGGEDARIETAGGLDTPDHEIGTDAVLVEQAIERAWSDDGVLVLMDLGSAVLSAEMALDLLPDTVDRSRVLLVEAPFVEGAVAAAVTARIGGPLEDVAAEARGGLSGKAAHLGVEAPPSVPMLADAAEGEPAVAVELEVRTEHGLHARPAAAFVRLASSYDADVRVERVGSGRGAVTARSLNAVAMLGVGHGDRIRVTAAGPQARAAIDAIGALGERNFDEAPAAPVALDVAPRVAAVRPGELAGLAASPGVAVGPVVRFRLPELGLEGVTAGSPAEERRALEEALEETRIDIERQRETVRARVGRDEAGIFDAHLLLLDDESLAGRARADADAGTAAAVAWHHAVERVAAGWEAMEDPYLRARAGDVRSVGAQVLARILGVPVPRPELPTAGVLVAADLAPADAASLDPARALGVATAFGGPTSHAAVLARSLGIPAVVGVGAGLLEIADGATVALDGDRGTIAIDPAPDEIAAFEERRRVRAAEDAVARRDAREAAATLEGVVTEVAANVGSVADVERAVEAGCDGVGLFRTEFLFLDRPELPSEEEQEATYRGAAEALGGRPMIVRTLDVGADKPLPAVEQRAEANPFLGVRGLRLGLERPELLAPQLRAIVRVAADHPVRVMFPMVATLAELLAGRALVARAIGEVRDAGGRPPDRLEVGVMIEIPSAALIADALAAEADFFSIGTNDLTQYTLAAERGNEHVAALADPLHPAVLALIRRTCDAASAHDRWVGVCGELAGEPSATALLLGLGVRELSMSAPAIPYVKRAVREVDLGRARELSSRALELAGADEVRALLAEG